MKLCCADCWYLLGCGKWSARTSSPQSLLGQGVMRGHCHLGQAEMTEENTQQNFAHSIETNEFLFYFSHGLRTFVQSVPQVFGNLLRSNKWVTCSPFHLILNLFLVSSSAVDLANDFLKLFQYSWHGSNSTCSLMPRFGSFLKVFHCPIFFLED